MPKFEKIIAIPSCFITMEIANSIADKIYNIAEERANFDYQQALIQFAPQMQMSPEAILNQYQNNIELKKALVVRKDRTIFISPTKNVEYTGQNVLYDAIPNDVSQIIIDIPGVNEKLVNLFMTNDLMKQYPLHSVNKILIQGYDEQWVNNLYVELGTLLKNRKKILRDLIYRLFRPLGLLGLICLSFLEFKGIHWLNPRFTFYTPLNGLSSILTFLLLLLNYYAVFWCGGKITQHLYPYIEFESRLSQPIKDWRWLWGLTIASIYTSGVWASISTILF